MYAEISKLKPLAIFTCYKKYFSINLFIHQANIYQMPLMYVIITDKNVSFVTYHGPCGGTSSSQSQLLGRLNTMSTENPKANRKVCSSPRHKYSWSLQGFWRTDWKIKSTAMAITYSVSMIMLIQSRRCLVWIYAHVKRCLSPSRCASSCFVWIPSPASALSLGIFVRVLGMWTQLFALLHFKKIGRLFLCLLKRFLWNISYTINLTKLHVSPCYCRCEHLMKNTARMADNRRLKIWKLYTEWLLRSLKAACCH